MNYDTNVLTNVVVTPGTLLGSPILTEPGTPGVTAGKVIYRVARTSSNLAVPVNGTFFTIQFQVKNDTPAVISNLNLSNVKLINSAVSDIPNQIRTAR